METMNISLWPRGQYNKNKHHKMKTQSEERFEEAFENILEGNLQNAAAILEEEHRKDPKNISVLLEWAISIIFSVKCQSRSIIIRRYSKLNHRVLTLCTGWEWLSISRRISPKQLLSSIG
jgi:hypothetical protein